jgi:hypothetical protein
MVGDVVKQDKHSHGVAYLFQAFWNIKTIYVRDHCLYILSPIIEGEKIGHNFLK